MHFWWAWTPGMKEVEMYEKSLPAAKWTGDRILCEPPTALRLHLASILLYPALKKDTHISSVLWAWPHGIFLWVKLVLCPQSSSFCVHPETLCGLHAHSVFHACLNTDQRSEGGAVWAVLSSPDPALLASPLPTHCSGMLLLAFHCGFVSFGMYYSADYFVLCTG